MVGLKQLFLIVKTAIVSLNTILAVTEHKQCKRVKLQKIISKIYVGKKLKNAYFHLRNYSCNQKLPVKHTSRTTDKEQV